MAEVQALNLFGRCTELQCFLNPQSHHECHVKMRRPVTKEWDTGQKIRSFRHLWVGMKHHISKYPPPTEGVLLCLKAFNWHTSYHWQKARKLVKLVVGKTSLIFNTSPVINYRERNESNCIRYDWTVSFLHYFSLCERFRLYQTF